MVSVVTVILAEIMILRGVDVLNWIGLKTMEIVTSPHIGMIQKMVLMAPDMEAMVEFQQTSKAAPSTLLMDPMLTSKLEETVTVTMVRHMQ